MPENNEQTQPDYMQLIADLGQELLDTHPDPNSVLHGIRCYVEGRGNEWRSVEDCHSPTTARSVIQTLETREYEFRMDAPPGIDVEPHFYAGLRRMIE